MADHGWKEQDPGLFHELYGAYFACVTAILRQAAKTGVTRAEIRRIEHDLAFAESAEAIEDGLLDSGTWPLLRLKAGKYVPVLPAVDTPLTLLQKRWLKTLLLDPRISLFGDTETLSAGLEDVEPLFTQDQVVLYDRYSDGDPYEDEAYRASFRVLLEAVCTHRTVELTYHGRKGFVQHRRISPWKMEYSPQDDCFRVLCYGEHNTLLVRGVAEAALREPYDPAAMHRTSETCTARVMLTDERSALDRAMQEFAWMEKQTERVPGTNRYRFTLKYNVEDEQGLLIRLLGFGPLVRVVAPIRLVQQMRERIARQCSLDIDAD